MLLLSCNTIPQTLLAGDRSLADVVAHEIAHSWTGNLVTNATWDHFWLNEGWTTWYVFTLLGMLCAVYRQQVITATSPG